MVTPPSRPPPRRSQSSSSSADSRVAPVLSMPEARTVNPRIILNAVEGWGKTSLAAFAPDPAIIMAHGETGYLTLLGAGRVPQAMTVQIDTWLDLIALVDSLIQEPQDRKLFAFDAIGGFERLCQEYICEKEFNGDWGERGFASFQKGYELSAMEWMRFLNKLDRLRESSGATVLLLSHCRVKTFKNPLGADYDRYVSDVHDRTWNASAKWADIILFGTFDSVIETKRGKEAESLKKGKGTGGHLRKVYTERRDAFDAKNRYGMQPELLVPETPAEVWGFVWSEIMGQKGA